MLFTEPAFLFLFLPLLLLLYYLPWESHRNVLLLVASLIFYVSGGGSFLLLMLASIVANYLLAVAIDRARGTTTAWRWLAATVAGNLAVLFYFKYANFAVANVNGLRSAAGAAPMTWTDIALPIGISFFTFHAISYVVDVYRGHAIAQKNPVHAALYLLLFPQLIAGPIIRYREIADQLATRHPTLVTVAGGVRRFIIGLAKKVIVANTIAASVDRIFALPVDQLTAPVAWLGIVGYALQIYFDFSGYSDMAIGLAAMFGFRFPENFNYPYIARSVQEFWRRWHMTLSAWFRDYVYVPLGGNRGSSDRTYVNLITVFFLCGLWHGASWNFVVWGLWHGAFLVCERLGLTRWLGGAWRPLAHAYTLLVVLIGWVFFRADTLTYAVGYLEAMAGLQGTAPTPYSFGFYTDRAVWLAFAAGCIGSLPVLPWLRQWRAGLAPRLRTDRAWLPYLADVGAVLGLAGLFVVSAFLVAAKTYSPFIYFRF